MRELAEMTIDDRGVIGGPAAATRRRSVTVNMAESPLSWLKARGKIDARQFEAGERLRADYEAAASKLAALAKANDKAGFAAQWTETRKACGACHSVYKVG